ncbi:MAG: FadR family transcriptional regulator [Deltaproteobacteria bacterium]|nr:FadR family transcriptional regulator [Deltaproteobacteria bacterium]
MSRAITEGIYVSGDRLPAERVIAESLGASRATVRNALRMLEKRELVRRRVGSGTFVLRGVGDERNIAEITSPLELIDVRLAVEPEIARLAVLHGNARDIREMMDVLAELERIGSDFDRFTELDVAFHLSLANATHNPLLVWIYREINSVRRHAQWHAVLDKVLTPQRMKEYNQEHRILFEMLRGRDADGAVKVITNHLVEAQRDLIGIQAIPARLS